MKIIGRLYLCLVKLYEAFKLIHIEKKNYAQNMLKIKKVIFLLNKVTYKVALY